MTIGELTVAILADLNSGMHAVFDSQARNANGMLCLNGAAVLLTFADSNELLNYIVMTYHGLIPAIFSHFSLHGPTTTTTDIKHTASNTFDSSHERDKHI